MSRRLPNLPPMSPEGEMGHITVTRVSDPTIARREPEFIWTWEGPDLVLLDREMLLDTPGVTIIGPTTVKVGPFTLELLGSSWGSDGYVALRKS